MLALSDLSGYSEEEVLVHLIQEYTGAEELVRQFEVLIAYESVGDFGCDSSSFFLLRKKATGELFEVHGGHCSCNGFEDQFTPSESSVTYLKSSHFYFSCGGYEENGNGVKKSVKDFIDTLE